MKNTVIYAEQRTAIVSCILYYATEYPFQRFQYFKCTKVVTSKHEKTIVCLKKFEESE